MNKSKLKSEIEIQNSKNYDIAWKSEAKKLKKERLAHIREINQIRRKWTFIYSSMIFVYAGLIILFIYLGWKIALVGTIFGLCFPVWNLATTKAKCEELTEKVKRMKEKDDKIVELIKLQELLEKNYE